MKCMCMVKVVKHTIYCVCRYYLSISVQRNHIKVAVPIAAYSGSSKSMFVAF